MVQRTLVLDDDVDLTVLLEILRRLEALRAFSIVLRLVHLVDSVEDDGGTGKTDTSTADGDSDVALHGVAGRDSSIRGILANADVGNSATLEGLCVRGRRKACRGNVVVIAFR